MWCGVFLSYLFVVIVIVEDIFNNSLIFNSILDGASDCSSVILSVLFKLDLAKQ